MKIWFEGDKNTKEYVEHMNKLKEQSECLHDFVFEGITENGLTHRCNKCGLKKAKPLFNQEPFIID